MTKVLYLGVYRDQTGWGQAAIDYILALDAAGVDVVPRAVKLNDVKYEPPARICELEQREARGADVVIQHVLPHLMEYSGAFGRNIALYASETSDFAHTTWPERLSQMDEVWFINGQMASAAKNSGVGRNVNHLIRYACVPHAANMERFHRTYKPLPALAKLKAEGNFLFYTVGEMTRRKNLAALLKAFHLEFTPDEPVQLVIKTGRPGQSEKELQKHLQVFCAEIRRGLKLYYHPEMYKTEFIIGQSLTDEEMLRLHSSCDCFVQPSYGEAWSIPAFDAMAMGKTPIVTACGGYLEYVSNDTGWLVPGTEEPVFGVEDTFGDLFTGHETWTAVSIPELRLAMRQAYEQREWRERKANAGIERAYDFSYEKVGSLMRRILES